jgi:hypothetical protein
MSRYVIRRIRLAHCARGPARCEKCREMDREALCLLDVDPANYGRVTRRVIEIQVAGESVWREFDVVRVFERSEEALAYAAENGIADVEL